MINNWKPVAGDFRIAHFLGLHAVQVLPFCAWFLHRSKRPDWLIHVVGVLYLMMLAGAMVWPCISKECAFSLVLCGGYTRQI